VNAKGWHTPEWMAMMRLDNRVAYITTGIFVIAMLVVGAELLHATNTALRSGDRGLLDLYAILQERFGAVVGTLFLVGFAATTFSSIIGVWHGVSMLFADFVAHIRGQTYEPGEREQSWAFRAYLFWLTFPPMSLLFLERPFALVIAYGALGAFFMPFLALTLLWLLNSDRTPREWRNGVLSNVLLTMAAALFIYLCVDELARIVSS
jgi:Mn2+/Fe2+ NRAMP family transporter